MSADLEKMAEEIRAKFKECVRIVFCGQLMVAPGEWLFRLVSAEAKNGLLLLKLDDGESNTTEIELWEPAGLKIDKRGRLAIGSAKRVRFDSITRDVLQTDQSPILELC